MEKCPPPPRGSRRKSLPNPSAFLTCSAVHRLTVWSVSSFACMLLMFVASTATAPYQSAFDSLRNVVYVCSTCLALFLMCLLLCRVA